MRLQFNPRGERNIKNGLKKGPWTPEEDRILINYINQFGHSNWRALPKQAGLLRCGKSCRLRWVNYLKPDIKRGNFSREEEETIIKLHEMLGNRWSAIAARLPGRTDNEIKNVWHTYLKKRVKQIQDTPETKPSHSMKMESYDQLAEKKSESINNYPDQERLGSPQQSTSDVSATTTTSAAASENTATSGMNGDALGSFPLVDETCWSDVWSAEEYCLTSGFPAASYDPEVQFQIFPVDGVDGARVCDSSMHDDTDFWFNILAAAGDSSELW
ncbi:hypothetical protein NMG60_11034711 [Bertholletia excelsa]